MNEDHEYAIRPNKTQIKREIKVLNDLGKQLVALPEGQLASFELSDEMRIAIKDAKRFSKGALQRQLRRIANLMQHEDVQQVELTLKKLLNPSKQDNARFHQLEQWRDALVTGDDALVEELIELFPSMDIQHFRQLVRNSRRELAQNKAPKSARSLFKILRQLDEQTEDTEPQSE
jgi:ribosome-associated protein